ncbi:MAG: acyltransferase [Planctomycetota bacterium]
MLYSSGRVLNNLGDDGAIRVGEMTHVRGELLTFGHGGAIRIGDYCYVGEGTRVWSALSIEIGDRVLVSHNVNIFDNDTHPIDDAGERHRQFASIISEGHPADIDLRERPVTIGDDVLIGCQSVVLSGVRIGAGAVIAAGSVVTGDVAAWTVVAGNPARAIRELRPTGVPVD